MIFGRIDRKVDSEDETQIDQLPISAVIFQSDLPTARCAPRWRISSEDIRGVRLLHRDPDAARTTPSGPVRRDFIRGTIHPHSASQWAVGDAVRGSAEFASIAPPNGVAPPRRR